MMSLQYYTTVIRPDENGNFVAYIPAIPSCHALGETLEEACAELGYVFEMIQEEYEEEGQVFPPDVELLVVPVHSSDK